METLQEKRERELAHRVGDGFEVTLLWAENDDTLTVVVNDWRTEERFEIRGPRRQRARRLQPPVRVPGRRNLDAHAMRFVAVGELLVDVLAQGSGHEARIRLSPAGSAFNAAVAARAAGADTTVLGTVGDDPAGRLILTRAGGARRAHRGHGRERADGTFLLMGEEVRVDRGVAHDIRPAGADRGRHRARLGLHPAAAEALAARARRLGRARRRQPRASCRRAATPCSASAPQHDPRRARRGPAARGPDTAARSARWRCWTGTSGASLPRRVVDSGPGAGDAFAATLLVALARGAELEAALSEASQAALDSLA